ncbi:amidase signature enzyme, partial [Eremomyces bilateralis CBS 781.70]
MSVFFDSPLDPSLIAIEEPKLLLESISITDGITLEESGDYRQLLAGVHDCAEKILRLPDYQCSSDSPAYPRGNIHRPTDEENVLGHAWAHRFHIRGNPSGGPLKGKTVCLKDCIAVAGVPQFFGTDAFAPWTPKRDAAVVTRALDAGAEVVGTATCENFCNSTSSFTSAQGVVENPFAEGYSSGGSTSGGAALVGAGHVHIAIGADQGGSIRIPAAFCGCVGLKPTHGLVPYTGVTSGDAINDHVGPIARTVLEVASCLDALSGQDRLDDRTLGAPPRGSTSFAKSLRPALSSTAGFRVGILVEGFEHQLVDPAIKDLVLRAARRFETLGAIVEQVSVPCHMEGPAVWTIQQRISGALNLLGLQHGRRGLYPTEFEEARLPWTNASFQRLFPTTKNTMINGLYLAKNFPGLYPKTLNLAQQLKDSYEKLFETYDVVVMPTVPCIVPKHVDWRQGESPLKALKPSVGLTINTAIFNITGHPAMTIPVGFLPAKDDHTIQLPVGMQLVGGLWQEQKILDAGHAWQSTFDWMNFNAEDAPIQRPPTRL